MQFIQHICSLLNTVIRLLVIDEPVGPRAATPFYSVDTIIASNQMDHDTTILFALTHELRLVIKQKIKESETNGLDNSRFTCAIDSSHGSRYFSLTLSNRNFKPRWAVNLSRTITT